MIEGFCLADNPPFYPAGGTYADLLFWHLFIWGTRNDGTRQIWRPDEFRAAVFVNNADSPTALRSLNHWLGSGSPPNDASAGLIIAALFGQETVFEDWRIHLRLARKRSSGKDLNGKRKNINSVEALWKRASKPAVEDAPANEVPPFTHNQLHKAKAEPETLIQLLQTDMRATSLVGRADELAMLADWLESPPSIAVKCVIGGAGSGKTRLAIETCERAEADGWFATFLPSSELRSSLDMQTLADWALPQATLLVVDYAATSVTAIKRWLNALARRRDDAGHKLRILLLERHADRENGWWADLHRPDSLSHATAADLIGAETPYKLPPLDALRDRRALLSEVIAKAAPLFDPPRAAMELPHYGANPWFDQRLADNNFNSQPLYLIMAGAHAVEAGAPAALAMNKPDLAKRMADIESERLRKFAIARGFVDDGALLKHIAACVTLQNGCAPSMLPLLIKEERQALEMAAPFDDRLIASILCDFLPVAAKVEPVRPDLIGESFCLPTIEGRRFLSDAERCEIVLRCWKRDPAGTGDMLIRCACDLAAGDAKHAAVASLRAILEQAPNIESLKALGAIIPDDTLALREFAADLFSRIVARLRSAAAAEPDTFTPDLAGALIDIGNRLRDLGRREEALAAAEEALTLYRRLAAALPDAFTPDVAMSLYNIAICRSDLGRPEEALAAAEEALALQRQLAAARPGDFAPQLALALANIAIRFRELGRFDEALIASEKALALLRLFAAVRPDVFTPYLARALANIATQLSDLGRREEALAAADEALALYRPLAVARPDAFSPDFAKVLYNIAIQLGELDRREEALAAADEALALYRPLAAARPDAFAPYLAMTLNDIGIYLGHFGRLEEALAAAEEALALRRQLAAARPDAFTPDLASTLHNIAIRLSELGRLEEALAAAEEGLALRRQLAAARPDAFARDLANTLLNSAVRLSELGRLEEALAAAEEGLALQRQLAAARPDAFAPDLANALHNIAIRLSELGRLEEALAAAEEALALRRKLAAARPDAFTPDVANALHSIAIRLRDFGRRNEALAAAEEALALRRKLAAARPDAFTPDLASSLHAIAIHLGGLGRTDETLAAADEALAVYRSLAAARPDAFTPDLARCLSLLGDLLECIGNLHEAVAHDLEAITVLAPYLIAFPHVFGQVMKRYVHNYIRRAEASSKPIDSKFLGKIAKFLP